MQSSEELPVNRFYFREPIPEIYDAARYLAEAVNAHLQGQTKLVEDLIELSNMPIIRDWLDSIWGKKSPYIFYRYVPNSPPEIIKEKRVKKRMPPTEDLKKLILRDGYHCRICGIPVVRVEIRERLRKLYPHINIWGTKNIEQHAAFQALWLQYDHIIPHSRGGDNNLDNMLITCAACNYGRMHYTFDEVGLADPRLREPVKSSWDGLERLLKE